jgi:hypothetical protein
MRNIHVLSEDRRSKRSIPRRPPQSLLHRVFGGFERGQIRSGSESIDE